MELPGLWYLDKKLPSYFLAYWNITKGQKTGSDSFYEGVDGMSWYIPRRNIYELNFPRLDFELCIWENPKGAKIERK